MSNTPTPSTEPACGAALLVRLLSDDDAQVSGSGRWALIGCVRQRLRRLCRFARRSVGVLDLHEAGAVLANLRHGRKHRSIEYAQGPRVS